MIQPKENQRNLKLNINNLKTIQNQKEMIIKHKYQDQNKL